MKSFKEITSNEVDLTVKLEYTGVNLDLLETALTWAQLQAPDRTFRVDLFLKQYTDGDAFELTDGKEVKFEYDPAVAKAVRDNDRKTAMSLGLVTVDGGKLTYGKLQKNKSFGGGTGGSGGGSDNTKITESAQCVYCQCLWNDSKTEFSPTDLSNAYREVFVDATLDEVLSIDDSWKESSIVGAKVLKRALGAKTYKWFRNVGFHIEMDRLYAPMNTASGGFFTNINKWNPADIYAVAESAKYKFSDSENLVDLNDRLLKAYDARDVLGISLKKLAGRARITSMNYRKVASKPIFKTFTLGKRDFFKSKDGYLQYDGGEMQFRTFPEFQCEIIGKKAKHGKVSQGPIRNILILAGGKSFEERKVLFSDLKGDREKYLQKFYYECSQSSYFPTLGNYEKFKTDLEGKTDEWLVSKYMVVQVFNYAKGKEQKFCELLLRYAKSTSPTSAVHLKVL